MLITGRTLLLVAALLALAACAERDVERDAERRPSASVTTAPGDVAGSGAGGPTEREIARALFERVNDERVRRGLEPLAWSHELTRLARSWSEHMVELGRLEHRNINELLGSEGLEEFRALGENIFRATGPVPAGTIHVGWMKSAGHRQNILQPGFNRIGIGVVCTPDGAVYATQEFGRTGGAERPPLQETTPPEQPIARAAKTGPSCPA